MALAVSASLRACTPVTRAVVAVPPPGAVTAKSVVPTFSTASLNVTRNVSVSAFVSSAAGDWRSIRLTLGAVLSPVAALTVMVKVAVSMAP